MGYPWPLAPMEDGTGTTPLDMQRIIGAQHMSAGVLPNGGLTVEGTSSMEYRVNKGACFMWTSYASRLGMLVPVDETTIQTAAAPSTGKRTDTIYVDGRGGVRVTSNASIPEGVAIAKFEVPAGITATRDAQQSIDRKFAIATGATLGRLATWEAPSGIKITGDGKTQYSTRFTVPSDRLVRIDLTITVRSSGGDGRAYVGVSLDGTDFRRALYFHSTPNWDTYSGSWSHTLSEGIHTVTVWTGKDAGATAVTAAGATTSQMSLWDMGASR